jgi:hypothetical protein
MTAAGGVWRANPPSVRPRRPTSRPATCICTVRPANDAKPAWAIRWAAAVTTRYPWREACAAGPCIYNLACDRHPLLADALEDAVYIDAGILAHCREPGEHVMRMWPPPASLLHPSGRLTNGNFAPGCARKRASVSSDRSGASRSVCGWSGEPPGNPRQCYHRSKPHAHNPLVQN